MKALAFARGPRVRPARFERRSCLPVSAACVAASGMRETLSSLLGVPVVLRLFEPAIPESQAWPAIARDAVIYRVRGSVADAALILRQADAAALASALFGETSQREPLLRPLSPLERDVLDRTVRALSTNLTAVCGAREGTGIEAVSCASGFVTYFEVQLEEPIRVRIGIALSRDPKPEPRGRIEVEQLERVDVAVRAFLEIGDVEAATVARLLVGTELPLSDKELSRAWLGASGIAVARGVCGVRRGRYAFAVGAPATSE